MPKLSPEQRANLERQLADDDAADDDFEVMIRDGDKETRVPYSKGRSWLQRNFGIDLDDDQADDDQADDEGKPRGKQAAGDSTVRRFGRRVG